MHELFQVLARRASATPDRLAFDDGATRLSYAPLAGRVAAVAEELRALPALHSVVGVLGSNRVDGIIGQLAGWHAGKIVVPLPRFFPIPQLRHVVQDAGISHVLATSDMLEKARLLGVPVMPITERETAFAPPSGPDGGQIIYTSGSTGQPKGVLMRNDQMMWSAQALAHAIDARENDAYLSVLPLALLLETICAVMIPILVGAPVRLDPALAARFDDADGRTIADAVAARRPSCMVLVPQLLARWVGALREAGERAPDSLRFVAVGGATVPAALARQAWDLGIPVYEGYGLSECGSVVALNRRGDRRPGTVGKALSGLDVRIEDGEIVVRGPSVMERYVHGVPIHGVWHTGDVGEIDDDGVLTVHGRRDNLIVTPVGRNISPEWIESLIVADPRVGLCMVGHVDGPHLTAFLVPTARGEEWFADASMQEIGALVAECCRDVPSYAVPRRYVVVPLGDLARFGLLTGNGRIRRKAMLEAYADLTPTHDVAFTADDQRVSG